MKGIQSPAIIERMTDDASNANPGSDAQSAIQAGAMTQRSEADAHVLAALADKPATMPPKLFYDKLGSTLFTAICELDEYYPTRTEAAIFAAHGKAIGEALPRGFQMVDLGAGDCRKAAGLFADLRPAGYVAVDISGEFLEQAVGTLSQANPDLPMRALARDFTHEWTLPDELRDAGLLYFYPGSSIGNFDATEAVQFLQRLPRSRAGHTDLLIGFDRVKARSVLEAAYDDALGVTGAFNRNALLVANQTLGTDFQLPNWQHRAFFNEKLKRIEMHLVAQQACVVTWAGGQREFAAGESIHTESSHKYDVDAFTGLLDAAGFEVSGHWHDANEWYSVVLARAR